MLLIKNHSAISAAMSSIAISGTTFISGEHGSAMPPAFRRGWEGEGKPQTDTLARASGREPATRGHLFRFREREGKALGVPAPRIATAIRTNNGTPARREAAGRPARGPVGQRASGNERGRRACGTN